MAKRLFLFIMASFIGVMAMTSGILNKSEAFTLNGLGETEALETVEIAKKDVTEIANAPVLAQPVVRTTAARANYASYTAPVNSIQVAGRTLAIVDVNDTSIDAGDHVNKFGNKFLYGHNSAGVFGGLSSLGVGSTFGVTYGGVTTNYRVAKIVSYEKNEATGELQLNGSGSYMLAVSRARSAGVQYDISLMTCAGTPLGNGRATHRLVIFANAM